MKRTILSRRLPITPDNLFSLVHRYIVLYYDDYTTNITPKGESIEIRHREHNQHAACLACTPLNQMESHVSLWFDDWESNIAEHTLAVTWRQLIFDEHKRNMVLDLGVYLLCFTLNVKKANAWRKEAEQILNNTTENEEPQVEVLSVEDEEPQAEVSSVEDEEPQAEVLSVGERKNKGRIPGHITIPADSYIALEDLPNLAEEIKTAQQTRRIAQLSQKWNIPERTLRSWGKRLAQGETLEFQKSARK